MEFVGDFAGGKNFVEDGGAAKEAEIVLGATVKIDFEAGETGGAGKSERIVAAPQGGIGRRAEGAKNAQKRRLLRIGDADVGKFIEKRGAIGAHGGEEFGMTERKVKRPVAAHGNSGDAAGTAEGRSSIGMVNEGNEFADHKIFVVDATVAGVDVETRASVRRDDEEFADFVLLPKILDEIPAAGSDEELFVAAQTMKEVKNRIAARFAGVVTWWKDGAVANVVAEDFAGGGAALNAAEAGLRWRSK